MAATLADVARQAGVSTATASRVLNNKMAMPIPPSTVARIKQAASDLQYRPNALARALVTRRTRTIGLFSQEMTDPHFAQMLAAVEMTARDRGYHIAVCSDLEGILSEGRVDGVIMLADPRREHRSDLPDDLPLVYVWSVQDPLPNCISWSDFEGAYRAGRYLIELGHRRIGGLFGDYEDANPPQDKVAGFRQAMVEGGAEWWEWRKTLSADQLDNGYLLTREILRAGKRFTALFARNDFLAVGAMRALREARVVVPHEVSVVGYTDTILARCADPPLTSVCTPIADAGARAVQRLLKAIESKGAEFPPVILPTSLTVRESCAPPS